MNQEIPQTMKRVELNQFGVDNLSIASAPVPTPRSNEVLIKVAACSINYRDLMIANGHYKTDIPFPLVPLSDCAGYVVAVGEGVHRFKPGDVVTSALWQDWPDGALTPSVRTRSPGCESPGVLSEYAVLPEMGLVAAPDNLSMAEAACLPAAGLTAFAALTAVGDLKPGGTVLTLGTGGVSLFALQFAKAMGATVIITSSSDEKLAKAKRLGADHTINYNNVKDWGEQAFALTGGADVVVETAGAGTLAQSMAAVGFSGRIAYIGALSGMAADTNLMPLVLKNAGIQGVTVSHRADHIRMNKFVSTHNIHPVIDREYSFDESIGAIKSIGTGQHFGKLVITL